MPTAPAAGPARGRGCRGGVLGEEQVVDGDVDLAHDQPRHRLDAGDDVAAHRLRHLVDAHPVVDGHPQVDRRLALPDLDGDPLRPRVAARDPLGQAGDGAPGALRQQLVHPGDLARRDPGDLGDHHVRDGGLPLLGDQLGRGGRWRRRRAASRRRRRRRAPGAGPGAPVAGVPIVCDIRASPPVRAGPGPAGRVRRRRRRLARQAPGLPTAAERASPPRYHGAPAAGDGSFRAGSGTRPRRAGGRAGARRRRRRPRCRRSATHGRDPRQAVGGRATATAGRPPAPGRAARGPRGCTRSSRPHARRRVDTTTDGSLLVASGPSSRPRRRPGTPPPQGRGRGTVRTGAT